MRWFAAFAAFIVSCSHETSKAPPPPPEWPKVATIGGAALDPYDDESEWVAILERLVSENVTVVEADSNLSQYLSDEEFEKELAMMRRFSELAHERNLKVVWYYPSLEVITPNGETEEHSMFKDHPEWVQLGLDEADPTRFAPNVFYGSKAFWVDPGAESAWMCHLSGYRDYLFGRIRKVAATGVDGIWLDVPLFNDIVGKWACYREEDQAKFKADTGYEIPRLKVPFGALDSNDPAWRLWVHWRHLEIDKFLRDALREAKSVNPNIEMVVETVTMDYNAALLEGLDGSFAGPDAGFWHVWEVDVLSDTKGMFYANEDDWASLVAMFEFGRGADRGRAAWAFTYGFQEDDGEAVLFEAVTAQLCPYELKVPQMTTSVGHDYRKRVFGFLRRHEDDIFRAESAAPVAIVHSSASRDYRDGPCVLGQGPKGNEYCGVSLYGTWSSPEPGIAWWTSDEDDSVYRALYLGEYRGMVKALIRLHVPFDIIPSRRLHLEDLSQYELLLVPDLLAVSDEEAWALMAFAEHGGNLFFTGEGVGALDERGLLREVPALSAMLPQVSEGLCEDRTFGKGVVRYCRTYPGRAFLREGDKEALALVERATKDLSTEVIRVDKEVRMHFDLYRRGTRLILHGVNLKGVDGTFSVEPVIVRVGVRRPSASRVVIASARLEEDREVGFEEEGGFVTFDLPVEVHTMAVIE